MFVLDDDGPFAALIHLVCQQKPPLGLYRTVCSIHTVPTLLKKGCSVLMVLTLVRTGFSKHTFLSLGRTGCIQTVLTRLRTGIVLTMEISCKRKHHSNSIDAACIQFFFFLVFYCPNRSPVVHRGNLIFPSSWLAMARLYWFIHNKQGSLDCFIVWICSC